MMSVIISHIRFDKGRSLTGVNPCTNTTASSNSDLLIEAIDIYHICQVSPAHLYSHRTGHSALLAQEGGARPQGVSRHVPEGEEGGGAGSVDRQQGGEGGQVHLLLLPHVGDQRTHLRMEHGMGWDGMGPDLCIP